MTAGRTEQRSCRYCSPKLFAIAAIFPASTIIFRVRHYAPDNDNVTAKIDLCYQPILVPADVENGAIPNLISVTEDGLHFQEISPLGIFADPNPCLKFVPAIGIAARKLG